MRDELLGVYAESLPQSARDERLPRVRAYLEWLRNRQPSTQTVRKWLEKMKHDGYADGTVARDFATLRRFFIVNHLEWGFRRGEGPVIREQQVWAPRLDPETICKMVQVARGTVPPASTKLSPGHAAFLAMSTIWGLRREEMQELKPQWVDLEHCTLYVETIKHGRQRYHVIPPEVVPVLSAWDFHRISVDWISEIFGQLKTAVGLTRDAGMEVGWHSIRRSLTHELFGAGCNASEIANFLRWKRSGSDMAMRYASTPVIGLGISRREVGFDDRAEDEKILAKHPFLPFWR